MSSGMNAFLAQVGDEFTKSLSLESRLSMSAKLQAQFEEKLQSSNICMLPSYNHTLPTGYERGTYLALDVGGTNFRIASVDLCGRDRDRSSSMAISTMFTFKIDAHARSLQGHRFFDWLAERIDTVINKLETPKSRGHVFTMGVAWSFPVEYAICPTAAFARQHTHKAAYLPCSQADFHTDRSAFGHGKGLPRLQRGGRPRSHFADNASM
jgi:hexokinase